MATGPEHYTMSEELLLQVKSVSTKNHEARQLLLMEALVHATLAHAAAAAPVTSDKLSALWTRAVR